MNCSPPGSSVHGIFFQARTLEHIATSSSRGFSPPRARTSVSWVSCISGRFSGLEPASPESPASQADSLPLSYQGGPRWLSGKESACQCRRCKRHGLDPWVGKIPWNRKWQHGPVSCLGKKSHGWRSLASYSPWSRRESDTTEHTLSV